MICTLTRTNKQGHYPGNAKNNYKQLKLGGGLGGGLLIDCNGDIFEPGGTSNFLYWFLESYFKSGS